MVGTQGSEPHRPEGGSERQESGISRETGALLVGSRRSMLARSSRWSLLSGTFYESNLKTLRYCEASKTCHC